MSVITDYISVSTGGARDVIDLTPDVQSIIAKHGLDQGIAVVFVPGSTAAITTIEFEPGLSLDLREFLEKLLPYGVNYHHHNTWNDDNGAAHLQSALIGPSLTVPVVSGSLALGTWQQIVLVDCDTRARNRRIVVQLLY